MSKRKKPVEWVPLQGVAKFEGNLIRYQPIRVKEGPNEGQINVCILGSNAYFQQGTIDFEVNLGGDDSRCQFVLNHQLDPQVFVGFNFGLHAYGLAFFRAGGKWETIEAAGIGQPAKTQAWLKAHISVVGSTISMYVEGVRVLRGSAIIRKTQPALFLHGSHEIRVRNVEIHEQKPTAFIVMQYTDEFNSLYREVIKPTCERYGYDAVRADDIFTNGQIINDITRSIGEASVIIADITPNNPNVFYEVGYAHGTRKPTILLCERGREKLPFDVSGFRTLFYDNTIGGKSQIEERLSKHLENIIG
jgi:hypothetical protein